MKTTTRIQISTSGIPGGASLPFHYTARFREARTGLRRFRCACVLAVTLATASFSASAQSTDETARNKSVISEHHEHLNKGDIAAALQNYAEDTRNHGRPVGREGLRRVLEDIYATFPDWRMEIVEIIAADDSVVVRCTVSGTHKGVGRLPINGALLMSVEPTGKHFEVQHIHWYKLKDGKIVDHRANRDDIGMMRQLGILPPVPTEPPR